MTKYDKIWQNLTKSDKIWQNLKLESFKSLLFSSASGLTSCSACLASSSRRAETSLPTFLALWPSDIQWHPVTSSDQCLGNWWKLALNAWWWLLMLVECRWSWLTFVSLMPGFNLSPLQKSSLATLCDSARAWISWGTATCGACGRMAMLNVAIASDPTDPTADPRR